MNSPFLKSLRPRQWTKNLVLFAGVFFSEKRLLFSEGAWLWAGVGFAIFCGLAGTVYLLNDVVDVEKDRLHPEKCKRPIASGALPIRTAWIYLIILLLGSLIAAWFMTPLFFGSALAYFLLNIAYSFRLKHMVILDVLTIALGFVLRAQAGVGAVRMVDPTVYISHWLFLCTLMLALFLGLAKRRGEIFHMKEEAVHTRKILSEYSLPYIDGLMATISGATILAYAIYTVSPETTMKYGTDQLVYTVPFVLYGIFRYQYLIHMRQMGEKPAEILLSDRPLQVNLILWILAVVAIIHFPTWISK
jgi:4-hydroxybenzoate polyprenyltransferase